MPVSNKVYQELHDYIVKGPVKETYGFLLSWVLSWFTNDTLNYYIICRLFDAFIASLYSFPVYLSVEISNK